MKKFYYFLLLFLILFNAQIFSQPSFSHSYKADYSLLPDDEISKQYPHKLEKLFSVNYCFQSVMKIPRADASGYSCSQILQKLDQMGGLDKECYGVSYVDAEGKRKALFRKSILDNENHELYIKDKTAGGLNFDFNVDKFYDGNVFAVTALLNKNPANILLREIKKNEAAIFVLMQENNEEINLYVLIQCSYSPLKHKFLKRIVENAVMARVFEVQNWFYRMLCEPK
jgi:hypothetical protein